MKKIKNSFRLNDMSNIGVSHFDVIDSTNLEAKRQVKAGCGCRELLSQTLKRQAGADWDGSSILRTVQGFICRLFTSQKPIFRIPSP